MRVRVRVRVRVRATLALTLTLTLDGTVELEAQLAVRREQVEPLGAQRLQLLGHLGGGVGEARVDLTWQGEPARYE